jgi:homoserine O-acetyltransferase
MIALSLAALFPERVQRLLPIGAAAAASAWVVGFNHVQREVLRLDPEGSGRGLEVARQLAMLTYRSEASLELKQRRALPREPGAPGRYRVQGYLEHQGVSLLRRFHPKSYLALLDAMDSHDLFAGPARLADIRASALVVDIDTDALFTSAQSELLASALADAGATVQRGTLRSVHGHDAFLLDFEPMGQLLQRALALPAPARAAIERVQAPLPVRTAERAP